MIEVTSEPRGRQNKLLCCLPTIPHLFIAQFGVQGEGRGSLESSPWEAAVAERDKWTITG